MTDREAIRRLAEIVERMCLNIPIVGDNPRAILDDLAEPAAQPGTMEHFNAYGGDEGPTVTRCDDAPAPTVTREQAERFVAFLRFNADIGTSECPARQLSGVSEVPMEKRCWACRIGVDEVIVTKDGLDNWPAFFRAVADKLEGE